jgi:carbon starvation protein CstA
MVVLWAITVYLMQERKFYWITLIPAVFMTAVTTTYLFIAPEGFSLPAVVSYLTGVLISVFALAGFFIYTNSYNRKRQ